MARPTLQDLTHEPIMPDEPRLREQAAAAIQSGKLSGRAPDRTWGGPGVGAECSVCGRPVTKDENEFEIQFVRNGDNLAAERCGYRNTTTTPAIASTRQLSTQMRYHWLT